MTYLTLQDLSSAHCLSVGITNCSTSSVCRSDEIDTHASTASSRTESLNRKINTLRDFPIIFFDRRLKTCLFILRQVHKHGDEVGLEEVYLDHFGELAELS